MHTLSGPAAGGHLLGHAGIEIRPHGPRQILKNMATQCRHERAARLVIAFEVDRQTCVGTVQNRTSVAGKPGLTCLEKLDGVPHGRGGLFHHRQVTGTAVLTQRHRGAL